MPNERIEIDDFFPELRAIENNQDFTFQLLGLSEGQDFGQFVQSSKSAGKDHERLRQIRKPELPHEEVMKLERKFRGDVWVGTLLERKTNVQANRFSAGFARAPIRGFHNPGSAT